MQAAIWHGQRDIRIEQIDEVAVGPSDVRVDADTAGIYGSDLHEYITEQLWRESEIRVNK